MSNLAKVIVATAFIVFVMALGYHVAMSNSSEDHQRLSHDVESLRVRNGELAAENARLRRQIAGLRDDARIIERHVRDELGMVRRDEIVFLLNQPEDGRRRVPGTLRSDDATAAH